MTASPEIFAAARVYDVQGWSIVAVRSNKAPWGNIADGKNWRRKFTPAEIEERLGAQCTAIGFLGGELNHGIVPLDFDTEEGEAWWRENCGAAGIDPDDFPTVITPGKIKPDSSRRPGLHRYVTDVRGTLGNAEGELKKHGINVRGKGHAMLPPSPHPDGGFYSWAFGRSLNDFDDGIPACPDFVYEAIEADKRPARDEHAGGNGHTRADEAARRYCLAALAGEAERLARTTADRNTALTTAALKLGHLAHHGVYSEATARGVLLEACERNGVLGEDGSRQCTATFDSGWKAGIAEPREIPDREDRPLRSDHRSAKEDTGDRSGSNLPTIRIEAGKLAEIVDAAEAALLNIGADLYQRGGMVVRAAVAPFKTADGREDSGLRLALVSTAHVVERMTSAARWEKFDARKDDWVAANCPPQIAEMFLAREQWRLRSLTGVITAPTLRADGTILAEPGYDEATGLLFEPCGVEFPAVPSSPGRVEAEAALALLRKLFATFSFVADEDLAVTLSGLFTALVRRSLPAAPLHGITSPVAGSGKSTVVDMISMIATGKVAPVIAQGRTDEEMQKRLGAALIAGDSIISIDNCGAAVGGDLLCQAMTQQVLRIRLLGQSRNIDAPSNACLFATGNNLAISGDMTRRALLCSLDPKVERPELLTFSTNPLQTVRDNRGAYVVAALTIMRAHHLAAPPAAAAPLGSFEHWSRRVRDALVWLGLPDPCNTIEKARRSDPHLAALSAVVEQWHLAAGTAKLSVKQLVEKATEGSDLKDVFAAVAGDGNSINNDRFGKWLAKHAGRVVTIGDGFTKGRAKIVLDGILHGKNLWRIEMVT